MAKPTVYLDTNIFSALYFRGNDTRSIDRREQTQDWWQLERSSYNLVTSQRAELELRRGDYRGQDKSVAAARRIPYLTPTLEVMQISHRLIDLKMMPSQEYGDAVHLAFCIVHRIDYLLSWNYSHLVNLDAGRRLREICHRLHWHEPAVVSPETIPWFTFGEA